MWKIEGCNWDGGWSVFGWKVPDEVGSRRYIAARGRSWIRLITRLTHGDVRGPQWTAITCSRRLKWRSVVVRSKCIAVAHPAELNTSRSFVPLAMTAKIKRQTEIGEHEYYERKFYEPPSPRNREEVVANELGIQSIGLLGR